MPHPHACISIPSFDIRNWKSIFLSFKGTSHCDLKQSWLPQYDPRFEPGKVHFGWTPRHICFLAELSDKDIFNPVTKFNTPAFCNGDVVEIFLRPENQKAYFEIHISPANQLFQMRIPYSGYFTQSQKKSTKDSSVQLLIQRPRIQSNVRIEARKNRWWAVGKIPFRMFVENEPVKAGHKIRFSFGRYDYTRGQASPIISNSSPHTALSFHVTEEWSTMVLS